MNDEKHIWNGTPKDAMRVFLENAVAVGLVARKNGIDVDASGLVSGVLDQIDKIARESYPLFQVMENSDLVLHAEGPGAGQNFPWLSALNWLAETASKNMRAMMRSTLDLLCTDGKILSENADLRLSGIAPGSLWIGLKLMIPESHFLPQDGNLAARLLRSTVRLPMMARFIDDENMRPGLDEAEPDPALRDISLLSLLAFSPTGKQGIHTLEISSREHGSASLSQRERVVLREALRKPQKKGLRQGAFIGEVREADLDKTRVHLRTQDGVIRCVFPRLSADLARAMIGRPFKATGQYETNREGRPRLLFVEKTEPVSETQALFDAPP